MDLDDDLPEDTPDLVQLLVREAGRILEDASLEFAMALPRNHQDRTAKLYAMTDIITTLQALMEAAVALDGLCRSSMDAAPPIC